MICMTKKPLRSDNYWTLNVCQTTSYEITFVRLCVCPSVRLWSFLVFSDIACGDS